MDEPADRLSLLDRPLAPEFELRLVALPPGHARPYREADWRDALVVLHRGEIELECAGGGHQSFHRGNVLWLAGLSLRTLRNRGPEPALLIAVSRRRRPAAHSSRS